MSQSPLTSLQEKPLLVSRPLAGSSVILAFEPGMDLVLGFDPDQAVISRDHDSLVFSLNNDGTVTIAGFFADEGALPAFTLPDGSLVVAETFFETFSPELNAAQDSAKTGAPSEDMLDEAVEGVQGLGALGTFYWGDGKLLATEDAEDSELDASVFHMNYSGSSGSASYLYAQSNYGSLITGVSGTESVEGSPGYYTPGETHRESIPLPGSDESWAVSGTLASCRTSGGEEKTGLAGTSGGDNPFEDSGFDIETFIQGQSSLADWTMGADAFGCITREVSVVENAAEASI